MVLGIRYAMSSTDVSFSATTRLAERLCDASLHTLDRYKPLCSYAISSTKLAYRATRLTRKRTCRLSYWRGKSGAVSASTVSELTQYTFLLSSYAFAMRCPVLRYASYTIPGTETNSAGAISGTQIGDAGTEYVIPVLNLR
eukprot:2384458-Rhodomonas_salina.4